MERLKSIKEQLLSQVEGQMGNLQNTRTKELGEVIDMIKDLSESMYYCSIVKAMEESQEEKRNINSYYYTEKYLPYRESDYQYGKMYYNNPDDHYSEENYPMVLKDEREGRSGQRRKMYMESKQTHQDSTKKIKELEEYMKDLTSDITEMIEDASPEEKAVLQKKINILATKLQNV